MINKKLLISGIIVVITVILIILMIFYQADKPIINLEKQPKTTIKIAYNPSIFAFFPLIVAQNLQNDEVKIELIQMEQTVAIPALLAKEVDYCVFAAPSVKASLQDIPLKTVTIMSKTTFLGLIGKPGLELADIKTIGIPYRYILSHYLALKIIQQNNLSAEIIVAGSIPANVPLLITGRVDALVETMPVILQLQQQGYVILKTSEVFDSMPQGLTTRLEKIENNPEEIEKFLEVLSSAIEFIQNNPNETKKLLYDYLKIEENQTNQKIINDLYPILVRGLNTRGIPNKEEINMFIKQFKAGAYETLDDIERQIVTENDIDKVFDFRFIK